MQYHAIPCNTMQYHAIPCNTMQYYAIQFNTMQYHAIPCIINNCGAYHCPVGSIMAIFPTTGAPVFTHKKTTKVVHELCLGLQHIWSNQNQKISKGHPNLCASYIFCRYPCQHFRRAQRCISIPIFLFLRPGLFFARACCCNWCCSLVSLSHILGLCLFQCSILCF